ncbi:MAG: aminoglycoside phosphotransferase family protein, partial [Candidatus Doudnabacteria bacterium]|nr:aminoglycoside phosphotransferase family protein [Candidatus Doudnabacteria bacterium]
MNEVLNRVKENYHLNNLELSHKVELGYLSDNYVLINGDKKYFLKKHRVADPIKVRQILDIEQLFFDRGIPAILPITFADNQTMFQVEDSVYSLYPFVEGSHGKGKHYSKTALKSAGEMLAKIHVAGQKDYPKIDYDDFVMWAKPDFLAKAKFLRELIKSDSEFDNMARDFLDLKVKIVEETETVPYENNFGEPQLIHGDFHGSNLFFNDKDEITHVFDFEKAQIQPPVLEIVRSMNFLCFGEDFG